MIINFIRHGKTPGNILKKYIGRTDEPLSAEGIDEIKKNKYPDVGYVFVSPMRRCVQTADIIYPKGIRFVTDELRECDFGYFEGRTYEELKDDERYRNWISSGGSEIPQGESTADFKNRCIWGFEKIIAYCTEKGIDNISIICHGGTIMSIMEKNLDKSFYEWQVENGNGFSVCYDIKTGLIQTWERLF